LFDDRLQCVGITIPSSHPLYTAGGDRVGNGHVMTLLYSSPRFLDHDTGDHPECAQRLRHISARLEATGLMAMCRWPDWSPVTAERLARIHSPSYAEQVARFAAAGGGRIESDTQVSPASADVALLATGAVCDAVCRVVAGEDRHALCVVRPPGHH